MSTSLEGKHPGPDCPICMAHPCPDASCVGGGGVGDPCRGFRDANSLPKPFVHRARMFKAHETVHLTPSGQGIAGRLDMVRLAEVGQRAGLPVAEPTWVRMPHWPGVVPLLGGMVFTVAYGLIWVCAVIGFGSTPKWTRLRRELLDFWEEVRS